MSRLEPPAADVAAGRRSGNGLALRVRTDTDMPPSPQELAAARKLARAAKALLAAHPLRPISEAARRKQVNSLRRLPALSVEALSHDAPARRTWYNRRAALGRSWHHQLTTCLRALGTLARGGAWAEWRQTLKSLNVVYQNLKALREAPPAFPGAPRSAQPRPSRMPREADWRQRVHAATEPRYQLAVALLCLVPLRPIDFARGVTVRPLRARYLTIDVAAGSQGRPSRRFILDPLKLPPSQMPILLDLLKAMIPHEIVVITAPPRELDRALKKASRKVWPRKTVCATTFRRALQRDVERQDGRRWWTA